MSRVRKYGLLPISSIRARGSALREPFHRLVPLERARAGILLELAKPEQCDDAGTRRMPRNLSRALDGRELFEKGGHGAVQAPSDHRSHSIVPRHRASASWAWIWRTRPARAARS